MAKTIDEILKDIREWQEKNPERSVMMFVGDEKEIINAILKGEKSKIVTCIASTLEKSPKFEEDMTTAMNLAKVYRKIKQQEENN